jgi:hypothetical protein
MPRCRVGCIDPEVEPGRPRQRAGGYFAEWVPQRFVTSGPTQTEKLIVVQQTPQRFDANRCPAMEHAVAVRADDR